MKRLGRTSVRSYLLLLCGLPAGCSALTSGEQPPPPPPVYSPAGHPPEGQPAALQRVGFTVAAVREPPAVPTAPPVPPASPFAGQPELSVKTLVQEVLSRNPTLVQMVAAWQAAQARPPQAKALEDPMLNTRVGPAAFGSDRVDGAFMVELSQKLPFPGKRGLRGENALAEASAAGNEVEDTRLQLIESAQSAYSDYFLAERAGEVNRRSLDLLQRLRKSAVSRYESGKTPTRQEVLQADVELGREQDRRLALALAREVAVARLNTLMHLPPDSPLPPSPRQLNLGVSLPDTVALRAAALARRPDMRAAADRVRAEQASLGLAEREFYPDVEVMAAYDAFWQERPLRPQVGLRLNLPVYKAKRYAAVDEARARIVRRLAELDRLTDRASFEVQEAYAQVRRSEQGVRLYKQTILDKARQNREEAESAYEKGLIPFVSLIDAQRTEVGLQDRYYEAVADYFRRWAALERAIGGPLEPWPPPELPGGPGPAGCVPGCCRPGGPSGHGLPAAHAITSWRRRPSWG